jgi:hypothetical protein
VLDKELHLNLLGASLTKYKVDYVLIGGLAVVIQGGDAMTHDMDIAFDRSDENIERLAQALEDLSAKPKRWRGQVNYRLQSVDLRSGWLHMESDAGDIDLVAKTPGVTYEELKSDAESFSIDGTLVLVASPLRLLAMKQTANRDKDQRHITEIEGLLTLRKKDQA